MSELFEVVDEKGKIIGEATRKECHEKQLLHKAAYIMIINSKGKILLQKRANTKTYPHMWTLSASGHVDYGESFEQTAERELKEEIGISVPLERVGTFVKKDGICNVFATLFLGIYDGKFFVNKDEVSKVEFFTIDKIRHEMEKRPKDFIVSVKYALDIYEKRKKKA